MSVSSLPNSYQQVQWIASSGTQYINTGVQRTTNTRILLDFEYTSVPIDNQASIGMMNVSGDNNGGFAIFIGSNGTFSQCIKRSSYSSPYPLTLNQRYKVDFNNDNKVYVGDTIVATFSGDAITSVTKGFPIFASMWENYDLVLYVSAKLYSYKMYESETLIRDFVPCYRTSDNVIGLYDLVGEQFYENAGIGVFTKGPNVSSSYVITFDMQGHGTQIPPQILPIVLPGSGVYPSNNFYPTTAPKVTRPTDPTAEGYKFRGWYRDKECTMRWNFDNYVASSMTLYANWQDLAVDLTTNRHKENFIYKRVGFSNWQEHEAYGFITRGSIEYATDAELKVTGSFDFEGYELPDVNDMLRVYYAFTDDDGVDFYEAVATFLVSYASLNYVDTLKGIKANGSLEGSSVLKILQDKILGVPTTIKKNSNAVYEAENVLKACGLQTNTTPSGFVLNADHTFDAGTTYLEMVNWLLTTSGYAEAFPDAMGIIQLKAVDEINNADVQFTFKNDDKSIMYPEVQSDNDWQNTPNVVKLLYNVDDACIGAEARNVTGSRASLEARGGREVTYFEEVSDIGDGSKVNLMKSLAESTLKNLSADVEYVTMAHAYVPFTIHDIVEIKYADMEWTGHADNISIDLSPATKTQTKIKKTLDADIVMTSSAVVYRGE